MPNILDDIGGVLTAPFKGVLDVVGGIINHVTVDPNQKAQVQLALSKLQADHDVAVMQAQTAIQDAQRDVIVAEAKSDSWIARNWRPILMLSFGAILLYDFFLGPMFGLRIVPVPGELWTILTYGISGYVGLRTVEKIAPTVAQAVGNVVKPGASLNK